jgi:hypothetical protein
MNLNPLSHIFAKDDRDLTPEELDRLDAEARQRRIEITRESVRNGPVSWRIGQTEPSGKTRRRKARDKASFERKLNKRHRREFMAKQQQLATLRGHLTILGQVECRNADFAPSELQRQDSAIWVVRNFGKRDEAGEIMPYDDLFADSLHAAREAFLAAHGVSA